MGKGVDRVAEGIWGAGWLKEGLIATGGPAACLLHNWAFYKVMEMIFLHNVQNYQAWYQAWWGGGQAA